MAVATMREWRVDLLSDTKTRADEGMRAAMAAAEVGDEQQHEDPTVARLNERVAALLGKPRGLFLPSGTMANLVSILVHCGRGEEILAEASSHILHFETGGPAGIAGAVVTPIVGRRGLLTLEQLQGAVREPRRNAPRPRLVWIEQTTNLGGGAVWPLPLLGEIGDWARASGLKVHVDGARLMNAAVAHAVDPASYGGIADSLWLDFSKGLGAPFGAVLVGDAAFIDAAARYKHMLGGAMRQAGHMAAACLHALDHNVAGLADDHRRARRLSDGIARLAGFEVDPDVETNIVLVSPRGALPAAAVRDALAEQGIRLGVFGPRALRLITHRGISDADIDATIAAFAGLVPRMSGPGAD